MKRLNRQSKPAHLYLDFLKRETIKNRIKTLKAENENAHACEEHIVKRYGYTNVDAFMQVYRATKKVKDSYEKKLADWNEKYGKFETDTQPRKNLRERLKEGEEKVQKEKKRERQILKAKESERE